MSTSRWLGACLALALAASGCESILGIKDRKVSDGAVFGLDASSNPGNSAGAGGNVGTGGIRGSDVGAPPADAPGAGGGIETGGMTGGAGGVVTGGVTGTGGIETRDAGGGGVGATSGVGTGGVRTGGASGTSGTPDAGIDAPIRGTGGVGGIGGVTGSGGTGSGGFAGTSGLGSGGTGTGGSGAAGGSGPGDAGTGGLPGAGGLGSGGSGTGGSGSDGSAGSCGADGAGIVNASLVNGGFETPSLGSAGFTEIITGFEPAGFGWSITTNSVTLTGYTWVAAPPYEGQQYLDLVGTGSTGGIRQSFQTIPGRTYRLTFVYANNPYGSPSPSALVLVSGCAGTLLSESITHSESTTSNYSWTTYSHTFAADSDSATLELKTTSAGNGGGIVIDDVVVAPE